MLITLVENTPNVPKFICPICPPKPKSLGFQWKGASLGVRSPWLLLVALTEKGNLTFDMVKILKCMEISRLEPSHVMISLLISIRFALYFEIKTCDNLSAQVLSWIEFKLKGIHQLRDPNYSKNTVVWWDVSLPIKIKKR